MTLQLKKVFPGLMCDSVEMFADGKNLRVFRAGTVSSFNDLPFSYIQMIREAISNNPEAEGELRKMHPDSERMRLEQFARCNFSGLDHEPDIKNGVLQQGEYWDCPLRGHCTGEGKICKPLMYKGEKLLGQEIKIIKLLVTAMTNEAIADAVDLPKSTFDLVKKKIYRKLRLETKQELAIVAAQLNII